MVTFDVSWEHLRKNRIGEALDSCLSCSTLFPSRNTYFQKSRHHIGQYCLVGAWNFTSAEVLSVDVSSKLLNGVRGLLGTVKEVM